MTIGSSAPSNAEIADELSMWAVGGGIITVALFSFAVPLMLLTAVAALPLLLIALVPGLLIAAVALPILLVRGLWRRVSRALRPDGIAISIATAPRRS
jgi:hypothetical protein